MKITEDADVYERAREALIEEHGIHIAPRTLITVLEVALDGRVTEEQLAKKVQSGKKQLRTKHADLEDAVLALEIARGFIADAMVWQGPAEQRDETLEMIDRAIHYFKP